MISKLSSISYILRKAKTTIVFIQFIFELCRINFMIQNSGKLKTADFLRKTWYGIGAFCTTLPYTRAVHSADCCREEKLNPTIVVRFSQYLLTPEFSDRQSSSTSSSPKWNRGLRHWNCKNRFPEKVARNVCVYVGYWKCCLGRRWTDLFGDGSHSILIQCGSCGSDWYRTGIPTIQTNESDDAIEPLPERDI